MVVVLTKIVSKIDLKTLTIIAKRLILVTGMGPRGASTDGYITVLKIPIEIVKMEDEKDKIILINFLYLKFNPLMLGGNKKVTHT